MIENKKTDNNIDIKEVIAPYLRCWYVYIICMILALTIIKLYSRYIIPEYNTYATILIKNNDPTPPTIGTLAALSEVNGLRSEGIDN